MEWDLQKIGTEWRAFIKKDIASIALYINVKYLIGRMLPYVQSIIFLIWGYCYWLNSKFLIYLLTNEILDTEWINKNSIRFQWIFWHIALYVPNWVHVQFWSSAKIHQTSLRFKDTYVCAEDKIRYYKDVICRSFQFQNILDIQIL